MTLLSQRCSICQVKGHIPWVSRFTGPKRNGKTHKQYNIGIVAMADQYYYSSEREVPTA